MSLWEVNRVRWVTRVGPWSSEISAFVKRHRISLLLPLALSGYSEKVAIFKPGSVLLPRMELASALILGFPASSSMRKKMLLLKPYSLWYGVMAVVRN